MRILILARHFPPHISGGARRPYGLALALKNMGHEVYVVAPDIPEHIQGLAVPHPNASPSPTNGPARKTPVRDFAREHLLLPDPDIRWTHRAVTALCNSDIPKPDWIMTTSPPESIHVAGPRLKSHFDCKWLADFRDLWLEAPLRASRKRRFRQWREKRIARKTLTHVDAVSVVDEHIDEEISAFTPSETPSSVIPNFAIPSHLLPRTEMIELPSDKRNIVYTGSFSLSDPNRLIEPALRSYMDMALKNDVLHIAGRLTQVERDFIAQGQTSSDIRYHGVIPLDAAMAMQEAADILMLTASPHATALSGKFQEYYDLNKPILMIGDGPWRKFITQMDAAPQIITSLSESFVSRAENKKANPLEFAQEFLDLMQN